MDSIHCPVLVRSLRIACPMHSIYSGTDHDSFSYRSRFIISSCQAICESKSEPPYKSNGLSPLAYALRTYNALRTARNATKLTNNQIVEISILKRSAQQSFCQKRFFYFILPLLSRNFCSLPSSKLWIHWFPFSSPLIIAFPWPKVAKFCHNFRPESFKGQYRDVLHVIQWECIILSMFRT